MKPRLLIFALGLAGCQAGLDVDGGSIVPPSGIYEMRVEVSSDDCAVREMPGDYGAHIVERIPSKGDVDVGYPAASVTSSVADVQRQTFDFSAGWSIVHPRPCGENGVNVVLRSERHVVESRSGGFSVEVINAWDLGTSVCDEDWLPLQKGQCRSDFIVHYDLKKQCSDMSRFTTFNGVEDCS